VGQLVYLDELLELRVFQPVAQFEKANLN